MQPLLTHQCDIARDQPVGTNGRTQKATLYRGLSCLFLPMSGQAAIENQIEVGYGWTVFFADGTDVQMGDRLTWNGVQYLVKGFKPFVSVGSVSHLEVIAETEHSSGL